jgi:hypothetical protein
MSRGARKRRHAISGFNPNWWITTIYRTEGD